jgi:hypothetical protein
LAILVLGGVVHKNLEILGDQDDYKVLRAWLPRLCELIGMHPVGDVIIQPYGHWAGGGAPSAVLFIEESAILVHTYPERHYIEVVLHSCRELPGEGVLGGDITKAIVEELDLTVRYRAHLAECNWRVLAPELALEEVKG